MTTLNIIFAFLALLHGQSLCRAAGPGPDLPIDPAGAQAAALKVLKSKGFTVLHQIEGLVSQSGTVSFQERWIDLAGLEYKTVRLMSEKSKLPEDPLNHLDQLRAVEPASGVWRTSHGDLVYRPAEKRWDPVRLRTADPHRSVFRRIIKEWYLGTDFNPKGTPDCCGGSGKAAATGPDASEYETRLKLIQAGKDPLTIKERPDGLLEEIKLRLNNETIFYVKNEFLAAYPVPVSAEAQESLKRRAPREPAQPQLSLPNPKGRGHGLGMSTGNVVEIVITGSPAERAGISPGDRLISIDGTQLGQDVFKSAATLRELESAVVLVEKPDGTRSKVVLQKGNLGN